MKKNKITCEVLVEMKKTNIYKPGTKKYYKDALECIFHMCIFYDGSETKKGLKSLIDDIKEFAKDAGNDKKLYLKSDKKKGKK